VVIVIAGSIALVAICFAFQLLIEWWNRPVDEQAVPLERRRFGEPKWW
jgi:hypothetical protein